MHDSRTCGASNRIGDTINKNAIPAIVNKDIFNKVQDKLKSRKIHSSSFRAIKGYKLSGKVFCGNCGCRWNGYSCRKKTKAYNYYRCKNNSLSHTCDVPSIESALIEDIVLEATLSFVKDNASLSEMALSIYNEQERKSPELNALKHQLAETKSKMENIFDAIEKGMKIDGLEERYAILKENSEIIEKSIEKIKKDKPKRSVEEIKDCLKSLSKFTIKNDNDKQRILDDFVNTVFVYPDGRLTIFFSNKQSRKSITLEDLKTKATTLNVGLDKYIETLECQGSFGITIKPSNLRFSTPSFKNRRSIYYNASNTYYRNLDSLVELLDGVHPYDKTDELIKKPKIQIRKTTDEKSVQSRNN